MMASETWEMEVMKRTRAGKGLMPASVQASGGSEEQLADIGEMMSPLEQETVQGVRRRLAALHQATILASQDGLLLQLFLNSKKK